VPSRAPTENHARRIVGALAAAGWTVVVTGGPADTGAAARVAAASPAVVDLAGRTTLAELAGVLAGAEVVVVGNTGPAHLAAAVGTPVVSLFSPVVPADRWAPFGVPHVLLGDQTAACADSRARLCPVAGHPCLTSVTPAQVVGAVDALVRASRDEVTGAVDALVRASRDEVVA
jgi:ADP-heptose:LPS heptosyltransferase